MRTLHVESCKEREGGGGVSIGKNAGTEFVDSIFGRDRELENTEKLMNSIRLWNMRFDANCEDILRRPHREKMEVPHATAREVAAEASNESKGVAEDDAVVIEGRLEVVVLPS